MEYFQTAWRDGSSFNKGQTAEEFFYNQIYNAVEANVANRTLPFFNTNANSIPVELSTGKLINDENMIALEQISAQKGYSSNIWIFGDSLEKLQKAGIHLNLKKNSEPVLCMTKYANATHITEDELYISEGGAKTNAQFLYNYDSLDDRSKIAVAKYFKNAVQITQIETKENLNNYIENLHKSRTEVIPRLEAMKKTLRNVAVSSSAVLRKGIKKINEDINLAPIINAQLRHICQVNTGAAIKNSSNPEMENNCYSSLSSIINKTNENEGIKWIVGEALTKAMDAGSQYAKSCISKDFNREIRKNKEEQSIKTANLKKHNFKTDIEY